MYYLKHMDETDDHREIQNLKITIDYAYEKITHGHNINHMLVKYVRYF